MQKHIISRKQASKVNFLHLFLFYITKNFIILQRVMLCAQYQCKCSLGRITKMGILQNPSTHLNCLPTYAIIVVLLTLLKLAIAMLFWLSVSTIRAQCIRLKWKFRICSILKDYLLAVIFIQSRLYPFGRYIISPKHSLSHSVS